jgi:PhzF family phenazine biosynthesis protein
MDIAVEIVNAFIDGDIGGNPAGVVLDADLLSHEQKLQVAQQVGLSETAFVSASSIATVTLEFFTPTRQIAHCGHATIATFCRLRELGRVGEGKLSKETVDGIREIIVQDGMAYMEQRAPTYVAVEAHSALERAMLESLGIDSGDLMAGLRLEVVNTGNAFLIVPLKDSAILASLEVDSSRIAEVSDVLDLIGYYAFSPQAMKAGRDVTTRMFAPRYGIEEESATGMAAGPLACYLRDRLGLGEQSFHIEQGCFMQPASPSVIQVNLDVEGGVIQSVMAGGRARSVSVTRVRV